MATNMNRIHFCCRDGYKFELFKRDQFWSFLRKNRDDWAIKTFYRFVIASQVATRFGLPKTAEEAKIQAKDLERELRSFGYFITINH